MGYSTRKEFNLALMKFIFLIASFNAFFFTVLLLQKRPKALHDIILVLWLLYLGLFIGVYSFYSHDLFTHFQLLSISFISLLMLHGPFLYYYILTLISDKEQIQQKDFFHFVPFILFNIYLLIASFFPETALKLNIEKLSMDNNPPLLFLFFLIITALSGTVYFLVTIKLFRKLDINIFNNNEMRIQLEAKTDHYSIPFILITDMILNFKSLQYRF